MIQERIFQTYMKTGKIPERVLTRSVLKQLHTKRTEVKNGAGIGVDCAIFAPAREALFATNVRQGILSLDMCSPPEILKKDISGMDIRRPAETGRGQEAGAEEAFWYRLITGCANNLAAARAKPLAVELSLTLPEQMEEAQLKKLVSAAEKICSSQAIQIVGGHTAVSHMAGAVFAVAAAYGTVSPGTMEDGGISAGKRQNGKEACPGQDVVVSKWIGLEGTALIAGKCEESLKKRYPAWLVEQAVDFARYLPVQREAAVALKSGVRAMHDASEGGIFAALWELSQRTGVGLSIDLRKLPVRQETIEVCEFLGLNPYRLLSGGALVMMTDDGPALVRELEEQGIPGTVVGRTTQSKENILTNEGEVRYLERPGEDEIRKIFPSDGDMVFVK